MYILSSMKKIIGIALVIVFGCAAYFWNTDKERGEEVAFPAVGNVERPVQVVATFYPIRELAAGVVGNLGGVEAIVPAGMEPHDYEPSIGDIKKIYDADLFLLNGAGMDAWAEKLTSDLRSKGVPSLRLADKVILLKSDENSGHEDEHVKESVELVGMGSIAREEQGDVNEHGEWDPHFWLDPISARSLVYAISESLSQRFPENHTQFQANAERTVQKLEVLDSEYQTGLALCSKNEVVTSHDAFRYLAHRYGFKTHALAGISPEEEPSPKRLAELAAEVKEEKINFIFFETLVSPRIAETLARETGARTLVFNPIEGVTAEESAAGIGYWSLMQDNLSALQKALECK